MPQQRCLKQGCRVSGSTRAVWLRPVGLLLLFVANAAKGTEVDDILDTMGWQEPRLKGEEVFGPQGMAEVPTCTNLKIAILDLGRFALSKDLHPCSMPSISNHAELVKSPYAGPLHMIEAIQGSKYFVDNIDNADIVYVNDFCYYATGAAFKLATVTNQSGTPTTVRGSTLVEAYKSLLQSSRWKKRLGADFVFYDSHCGFGINGSGIPLDDFLCSDFRNVTLLTTDRALRMDTCRRQGLLPLPNSRVMEVPTVPHQVDPHRADMHLRRTVQPLHRRTIRVNKRSLCPDDEAVPAGFNEWGSSFSVEGSIMRTLLEPILADADDQVDCLKYEHLSTARDPKLGGGRIAHFDQTFLALEQSIFCLFLPGSTGMGYRFSEAMLAGCIPVLIGPPYAQLPFMKELRYSAAAVVLNVTEDIAWQKDANTSEQFAEFVRENPGAKSASTWSPDDVESLEESLADKAIQIDSLQSVPNVLQDFPVDELERRLGQIADIRSNFAYDVELTHVPNAVNVILSGICRRTGRGCSRSQLKQEGRDSYVRERCRQAGVASE